MSVSTDDTHAYVIGWSRHDLVLSKIKLSDMSHTIKSKFMRPNNSNTQEYLNVKYSSSDTKLVIGGSGTDYVNDGTSAGYIFKMNTDFTIPDTCGKVEAYSYSTSSSLTFATITPSWKIERLDSSLNEDNHLLISKSVFDISADF